MGSAPTPLQGRALGTRFLVTAAALVVLMAGLRAAQALLVPLVFAAFLAILCAPATFALKRRGVPESVSIVLVIAAAFLALTLLGGIVGKSVNDFVTRVPDYQHNLNERFGHVLGTLAAYGIDTGGLRQAVDPGALLRLASRLVGQFAAVLSDALLVILTLIFMLFELSAAPDKLRHAMGDPRADLSQFQNVAQEVKQYVVIKTYMSLLTGGTIGLSLALLGVDFPVLWGLLAFLLNYVPNIGSIIAAVPPVLLATVQFGPGRAALVAGVFVAVNMVVGNMLEPRFMGQRLGLSTLVVFLSLIVWGWLWGVMGMLLSVPLTMIVKILLEHSGQFRAVAVLMGGRPRVGET